jgi:type II restriction/modification system DNA methylase subunit YeeA
MSQLLTLITVNRMTQNEYNDRYVSWNSIQLFKKGLTLIRLEHFLDLDLRHQVMFTSYFSEVLPSGKKALIINWQQYFRLYS